MLARVQVEHEVHQRAFELRAEIPVDSEAGARDLCSAFEIENAQLLAQFPVRLGSEVELRRRAPAANLHVVFFALADGNAVVGRLGMPSKISRRRASASSIFLSARVKLLSQFLVFLLICRCVLLFFLELLKLPDG